MFNQRNQKCPYTIQEIGMDLKSPGVKEVVRTFGHRVKPVSRIEFTDFVKIGRFGADDLLYDRSVKKIRPFIGIGRRETIDFPMEMLRGTKNTLANPVVTCFDPRQRNS